VIVNPVYLEISPSINSKSAIKGTPDNERSTVKRVRQRRKYYTASLSLFMRLTQKLLRRPYTRATIGNMLPATFFINVAGHY
jgi:hypothetical protein